MKKLRHTERERAQADAGEETAAGLSWSRYPEDSACAVTCLRFAWAFLMTSTLRKVRSHTKQCCGPRDRGEQVFESEDVRSN